MVGLAPKWFRLAPNGTNPGGFSDQISVHLAPPRQMHWNLIWKPPGFVPFGANLTHFVAKPSTPGVRLAVSMDVSSCTHAIQHGLARLLSKQPGYAPSLELSQAGPQKSMRRIDYLCGDVCPCARGSQAAMCSRGAARARVPVPGTVLPSHVEGKARTRITDWGRMGGWGWWGLQCTSSEDLSLNTGQVKWAHQVMPWVMCNLDES